MPQKIELSYKTIIFTFLFILSLWFLYLVRDIILAVFVSLILMFALNPSVNRLESFRIPRWLAIFLVYLLFFGLVGLVLAGIVPTLIEETGNFINKIPYFIEQFKFLGFDATIISAQIAQLGALPGNIINWTIKVFSNIINIFGLIVITFYLLMERENLDHYLMLLLGENKKKRAKRLIDSLEIRLGGWVRGQLLLMTLIGVFIYVGLKLLGVEFALPLAILSALTEIIPFIGPLIAAVPAIIAGLTISPFMGLAVAALYFLVHQLEGNVIVPKVMEKAAGVNPLVTLLSLAVGFKLAGIPGAILAVPAVLLLEVVAAEFLTPEKLSRIKD